MFYGVPGGLSGAQWGTQDANGVWSGWANPAPVQQAAYDPGAGAAFGGAADAYTGDPSAYAAQMTPPQVQTQSPALPPPVMGASFGGGGASFGAAPAPAAPSAPDMFAGGSSSFNPATGTSFASGAGGPGLSGQGSMPQNPYLPAIAGDITRRTTDMMNAGIRQARGSAIAAGGFGGSGQGIMEGKAISGAADNLAGQLGGLYGSAWNQDQSRDLQRYAADQSFFGQQRGQDLQQAALGASLLGQGIQTQWSPLQGANSLYTPYTGLGVTSMPGSGGGWQGLLGGALGAAQLARNFQWL